MTKEPNFKNKDNLVYCLNIALPCYDEFMENLSKKEVLDLIKDINMFFKYGMKAINEEPFEVSEFLDNTAMKQFLADRESDRLQLLSITSNAWSGIWHFHEAIVPEKYKKDLPK